MDRVTQIWYWILAQNLRFHVVFGLSLALFLVSIGLFIYVIQLRNRRNRSEKLSRELVSFVEPIVLDLIYEDEDDRDWDKRISSMRSELNVRMFDFNSYARLSDYLVELHKQMEGETASKIERIYKDLGLPDKTLELLKKGAWHQKVKALSALAEFKVRKTLFEVIQFMDHPKRLVRDEAQFSAIILGGRKAANSIGEISHSISKWQQIRLKEECVKLGETIKEDVFKWLMSSNETLVELSLRICIKMGWYESLVPVSILMKHKRTEIRLLCVEAIGSLGSPDMIEHLMHRFEVDSRSVQLAIIKAIKELDYEATMTSFLVSQIAYGNLELALESARTLDALVDDDTLEALKTKIPEHRLIILEHVKYA